MKKIVFVNQSVGYLMIDVVNAFVENGFSVGLITGHVGEAERELDANVHRSRIVRYSKKNFLTRILTWVVGTVQITFLLLSRYKGWHVVYVTNPPLSYWAALLLGNSYSVLVYDIYPDALKNVNIDESHPVFRLWKRINRKVFGRARHLYTLSDGMAALLSRYVEREKIEIIPCWSGSDRLKPVAKDKNPFISEHGLEGKFVVMYSGNIGYTHNVEVIIEVAKRMQNQADICFCIIGEGLKKNVLMEMVREAELENCFFLPYQPVGWMNYSLASADVSVVTLTAETAFVSVPSKTYNLLAVGSPLLVVAPRDSEIDRLVREHKCGMSFERTDVEAMVAYIMKLKEEEAWKMRLSENSLKASRKYTFRNALRFVDEEKGLHSHGSLS